MIEKICVDPNSIYELEDEISRFNNSVSLLDKDIEHHTNEVGSSFKKCSRYGEVKESILQAHKDLAACSSYLDSVARDLSERASFLKEFEKKPLLM